MHNRYKAVRNASDFCLMNILETFLSNIVLMFEFLLLFDLIVA
jgi:hypothetical protein